MKLKNLIDALDSMMNLSSKAEMCICDEAGNDLWKGCLAKFDKNLGLFVKLLCGIFLMRRIQL